MTGSLPDISRVLFLTPRRTGEDPEPDPEWLHPSLLAGVPHEPVPTVDELESRLSEGEPDGGYHIVCFRSAELDGADTSSLEQIDTLVDSTASCIGIGLVDFDEIRSRSEPDSGVYLFSRDSIQQIAPLLVGLVISDATQANHRRTPAAAIAPNEEGDEASEQARGEGLGRPDSEVEIERTVADADPEADRAKLIGEPLDWVTTNLETENRSTFKAVIESEHDGDETFAVFILQFQRLHQARDRFGTEATVELRQSIQSRILESLRSSDLVTHLDTATFAVLCPDIEREENAEKVGERLSGAISRPYTYDDEIVMLRPSIGYTLAGNDDDSAENILSDAARASAFAQSTPPELESTLQHESNSDVLERRTPSSWESSNTLDLAEQIKRGIDRNQFSLHFQPVISMETGQVVGFESLCRWIHPEAGEIQPGRFIPVAEKTGLIFELDMWVLERGLQTLEAWADEGNSAPFLAVNISRPTVSQAEFGQRLGALADRGETNWNGIVIELTESAVLERHDVAKNNLQKIRQLGAEIALDDFGAGYSSFSALKNLPIDIIKIDRSFIAELADSRDTVAPLIEAISYTSNALDITLIAEGIETQGEFEFFEQLGCQYAQGFLFARGRPSDELDEFSAETSLLP